MKKIDSKIKQYLERATKLLDLKKDGRPAKLNEFSNDLQKYFVPIIVEVAKMIQLEELKKRGK